MKNNRDLDSLERHKQLWANEMVRWISKLPELLEIKIFGFQFNARRAREEVNPWKLSVTAKKFEIRELKSTINRMKKNHDEVHYPSTSNHCLKIRFNRTLSSRRRPSCRRNFRMLKLSCRGYAGLIRSVLTPKRWWNEKEKNLWLYHKPFTSKMFIVLAYPTGRRVSGHSSVHDFFLVSL